MIVNNSSFENISYYMRDSDFVYRTVLLVTFKIRFSSVGRSIGRVKRVAGSIVRFAKNNWSKRGDNREQSRFSLLTRIIVDARTMST